MEFYRINDKVSFLIPDEKLQNRLCSRHSSILQNEGGGEWRVEKANLGKVPTEKEREVLATPQNSQFIDCFNCSSNAYHACDLCYPTMMPLVCVLSRN